MNDIKSGAYAQLACDLASVAPVFTRLKFEDFQQCVSLTVSNPQSSLYISDLQIPSEKALKLFQNECLSGGMPLAVLPIESLCKPWATPDGRSRNENGAYQGKTARHVCDLCSEIGLQIPHEFQAMPDHLSLLLELLSIFIEAENFDSALAFAEGHFDWLLNYKDRLSKTANLLSDLENFAEDDKQGLIATISFYEQIIMQIDLGVQLFLKVRQ